MTGKEASTRYHCGHEYLDAIEKYGSLPAILAPGKEPLSFIELCNQAKQITARLHEYGLSRNDCIVITLPNGAELAVALLSVIGSFSCLPLNHTYTSNEYERYIKDNDVRAVIVQSGKLSAARDVAVSMKLPVIELLPRTCEAAGLFDLLQPESTERHPAQPCYSGPEDTALIMYTSGTTSLPKKIEWTQRELFDSSYAVCRHFNLSTRDRCLNVMPLFHLHGLISCLLAPLYGGGSVICTSGFEQRFFFSLIHEYRPTWYSGVSAIHHAVLKEAEKHPEQAKSAGLRFIRHSSSSFGLAAMKRLEQAFRAPVIEVYGMTEVTPITANPLVQEKRKTGSAGISVGPDIMIFDEQGNAATPGTFGEIAVSLENVRGHFADTGNGWYRTGDQGYMDDDGYLYVTERISEIINQGGQKIAPAEIDDALISHPSVADAASFAVPHASLGETICAAVVTTREGASFETELKSFLSEFIAPYKIPQQFVFVKDIPKNDVGKVQRNLLAETYAFLLEKEFMPPSTETEIIVTDIWQDVLGCKDIGTHDNLFFLGGDSIHATRIISRTNDAFHLALTPQDIFKLPTVSAFCKVIDTAQAQRSATQEEQVHRTDKFEEGYI